MTPRSAAAPVLDIATDRSTGAATPRRLAFPALLQGSIPYIAFFLSGAAALVYETTWSRYLGLFLGHSAYAQAIVLVTFLGGMALGALATGWRSKQLRRPWLLYAAIELAVGVLAIGFHPLYTGITGWAYERVLPVVPGGAALILVRWLIAGALIFPPSVLLGATFPLLAVGALRRAATASGQVLALLYFVNGLGGALGILVGGFLLLGALGLPGTMVAAGITSITAGALLVAAEVLPFRRSAVARVEPEPRSRAGDVRQPGRPAPERLQRMLLAVAFGTGLASLIYEVAWIRMLSLVLGSASHSFDLMLSAFLLGLSLGALWLRRRADRFSDPLRSLGVIQWVMGGLALATLPLYLASFHWTNALLAALDFTDQGYTMFSLGRYALCLAVMLPATFCAGMTLPLITRTLVRAGGGEPAVGQVYGANTLGSITGAALGALILLPLVGLKILLIAGALLDMALGVWLLSASRRPTRPRLSPLVAAAASLLLLSGIAWMARFDRVLLSSGVFRTRSLPAPGTRKIVFYRDGVTATVSATYQAPGTMMLATNGKADASLGPEWLRPLQPGSRKHSFSSDGATQALLALLTLAHAPQPRTAAVVGLGSGMSSHLLLGDPRLESLTTIEIEPAVIGAANAFYPTNRRVFDDARSHFAVEDARAYLASGSRRYDLIMSEPSNPWVSGVSSLFTVEFYDQVRRHLSENGVFGQWIHLYEINDDLILTVLAALHQSFDSYALFYTANRDMLIVASNRPELPAPDWSVLRHPKIADDLARFIPFTPQTLEALRFADRATMSPVLEEVSPNSDYYPVLDLGSERERYLNHSAAGFMAFGSQRFDPFAALSGRRTSLPGEPVTAIPEIAPARSLALAARLRAGLDAAHDTLPRDPGYSGALLRKRLLESFLAAGNPPPDWQTWMQAVVNVERDIHGTAQGVADERFYSALERYLAKAHAPVQARAAVDFLHAIARWDFPTASQAADRLLLDASLGEGWIPAATYRDGAVVAKLMTGDLAGARRFFDELAPVVADQRSLRSRLLERHIHYRTERVLQGFR